MNTMITTYFLCAMYMSTISCLPFADMEPCLEAEDSLDFNLVAFSACQARDSYVSTGPAPLYSPVPQPRKEPHS